MRRRFVVSVSFAAIIGAAAGCRTARPAVPVYQHLVVWNESDAPQRLRIRIDGETVYGGNIGTVDSFPKIVMGQDLSLKRGRHRVSADLPEHAQQGTAEFDVADRAVNVHVFIRWDGRNVTLDVGVSYGIEAYM